MVSHVVNMENCVCVCGGVFSSGDRGKQISEGMTVNA